MTRRFDVFLTHSLISNSLNGVKMLCLLVFHEEFFFVINLIKKRTFSFMNTRRAIISSFSEFFIAWNLCFMSLEVNLTRIFFIILMTLLFTPNKKNFPHHLHAPCCGLKFFKFMSHTFTIIMRLKKLLLLLSRLNYFCCRQKLSGLWWSHNGVLLSW